MIAYAMQSRRKGKRRWKFGDSDFEISAFKNIYDVLDLYSFTPKSEYSERILSARELLDGFIWEKDGYEYMVVKVNVEILKERKK